MKCKIPHIHIDPQHKYPIDINTIGQFTGCYDKNGREIYEGDIVISDNILNKVIFQDGAFMIDEISTFVAMDALSEFDMTDFEIVDNIYDNPELKNSESIYKD